MTYFSGEVRLRDIPKAGADGWIPAVGALLSFLGTAIWLHLITETVQTAGVGAVASWRVGLLVGCLGIGLTHLYWLDRELREVSA